MTHPKDVSPETDAYMKSLERSRESFDLQWEIIQLRYRQKKSPDEICEILGITREDYEWYIDTIKQDAK